VSLAKSANTSILYLPQWDRGLKLPSPSSLYQYLNVNYYVKLIVFVIPPAGIQYTHVSTDVTFNAGISTQMVTIPILDNVVVTESVLFSVVLTSADPTVVLHPETADITIEDDDCELRSCKCVPDLMISPSNSFCTQWSH